MCLENVRQKQKCKNPYLVRGSHGCQGEDITRVPVAGYETEYLQGLRPVAPSSEDRTS